MDSDSEGGEVPDTLQQPEKKKARTRRSSTSAHVQPLEAQSGSKINEPGEYLSVRNQGRMFIISACRELASTESGGKRRHGQTPFQAGGVEQPARRRCCGATQGQAAAGEHDEYVQLTMNILHDLLQSTTGTKFMKLQSPTSEKGEKEQETEGKGAQTVRAGRDDGKGWEHDWVQAEESNGASQRVCVGTLFEYVLTGSHSRALRVKRTGNEEDGYKGQGKGHVTTHLHCGVGRRGQLLQGICHFTWKRQGDWRPEQRGRGMFVS